MFKRVVKSEDRLVVTLTFKIVERSCCVQSNDPELNGFLRKKASHSKLNLKKYLIAPHKIRYESNYYIYL